MEAQYFHSTIYAFDPSARQKIVADFCTAVNNVAARVWYDEQQDVRVLLSQCFSN